MSNEIKVMIVDDHLLVRQGIKQLLKLDKNINVIDEAGDGDECLKKLNYIQPDIILLDINMPEKNGIEVLKKIKTNYLTDEKSNSKVLILTAHDDLQYLISAVSNGADGYMTKGSDITELIKAIYIIIEEKKYIQSDLIQILNIKNEKNSFKINIKEVLTKREQEVLIKVVEGMSNKEIADNLNISERTVKNHLSNIFKKIKVSDRTQAAIYAIKNNIYII